MPLIVEILLFPVGILFTIHEKAGWKSIYFVFSFLALALYACVLMIRDAFNGILSPTHPDSAFFSAIPWFHFFLIILSVAAVKALRLAYLKKKQIDKTLK